MEIIVTHLTRMRRGYICTAGICAADGRHVRPVFERGNLGVNMLARNGGPFALGRRVHLAGAQKAEAPPPHVEDWTIDRYGLKPLAALAPEEFWALLSAHAAATLHEAFGPELRPIGGMSFGTDPGQGATSLAYLRLPAPPTLHFVEREGGSRQIRVTLQAGATADLGVTDKRLYVGHAHLPNEALVTRLQEALAKSREVIVAVGLGRPYPPGAPDAVNWLQVNNLFPREAPLWETPGDLP
ncbi:hypothetical protein LLH23_00410 [bacterium]|nr:hypothetical protein [bacterium]